MEKYWRKGKDIIFFDLEFYVPQEDQNNAGEGFTANPFGNNHLLLGGTFVNYNPTKNKPTKSNYWLWNYDHDEYKLVKSIYNYFTENWNRVRNNNEVNDMIEIYNRLLTEIRLKKIAPKYSFESINKVLNKLKSEKKKKEFLEFFDIDTEEQRYIVKKDKKEEILQIFDKVRYWN